MKLPALDAADRYRGLYVFDFGEWTAIGYTADEVATLLESEQHRDGKVYRIHRAWPDGRMELQGVSTERFQLESALLFWRTVADAAAEDFESLVKAAEMAPPPCRAFVHLADWRLDAGTGRFVTALVFPAEHEHTMSAWLSEIGCRAGDAVEGGVSAATTYHQADKRILRRLQLHSREIASRSRAELLATVRRAVQR
jgi:hypothetical protein